MGKGYKLKVEGFKAEAFDPWISNRVENTEEKGGFPAYFVLVRWFLQVF